MLFQEKNLLSAVVENSPRSSTVGIADKVKNLIHEGKDVINLSAGRAFEPTPKYIMEAAIKAMKSGDTHQTMARGTRQYRHAIAQKLKRENRILADPETEIIATNGVKQGLTISFLCILNPGDEVIIENPCFVSYAPLIQYFGGVPVAVSLKKENKFKWAKKDLEEAITSKTKAILFNSPHNPTGVVHKLEDLHIISELAIKHDLFVLADEVYERVTWDSHSHISIAGLAGMKERTITLHSLTKSFCMGGWRIGFVYANKRLINSMEKLQQHLITSCNSFVQAAASCALINPPREGILINWQEWEKKCKYFSLELNKIPGLKCDMPEAGFFAWTDITALEINSNNFSDRLLLDALVAVIPGAAFGNMGEGYVRISCVKTWEEIHEGLKRIKQFIAQA